MRRLRPTAGKTVFAWWLECSSAGRRQQRPRWRAIAVALADGRVLIAGGSDPRDRAQYTSTELYDPKTRRMAAGPAMKTARYKFRDTAVRLLDGWVLIAGGGRSAELFDPRTEAFETVAGDLGHDYSFASATLLSNGDVVILGGYDDAMRNSDGVWRFSAVMALLPQSAEGECKGLLAHCTLEH